MAYFDNDEHLFDDRTIVLCEECGHSHRLLEDEVADCDICGTELD